MQYMSVKRKDDFVSIVIPVYNAAPFLERTLNSVFGQTFQDWEMILVDDGSKDESLEVIRTWMNSAVCDKDRIFLLTNETNHGAAYARNIGMRKAVGQYLVFLDADDYWTPDKLEKQYQFMKEKDCAFSFTGYEFANGEGVRNGKVVHVPEKISYKEALTNTTISTITVMFDRNKIPEELLLMPENCSREDTATWWQILKNGYTAYGLDEALSVYCRHSGSHSANKLKAIFGTYRMYREQEQLGFLQTMVCMVKYIYRAVKRRL